MGAKAISGRPRLQSDDFADAEGESVHTAPDSERRELLDAFRQVLIVTVPPASPFLELGRQIQKARLYYFVNDELPKATLPQSYAANLLHAATRYYELENDEPTRARVRDDQHVEKLLAEIRENGRWPYVRDELANCSSMILQQERGRRELEQTLLEPPLRDDLADQSPAKSGAQSPVQPVKRDKKAEARDKWIYMQCCRRTPHDAIAAELKRIAPQRGWSVVTSKQRIQQIGNEYADRHGRDRPPARREK